MVETSLRMTDTLQNGYGILIRAVARGRMVDACIYMVSKNFNRR
jgi:hypothetical protein